MHHAEALSETRPLGEILPALYTEFSAGYVKFHGLRTEYECICRTIADVEGERQFTQPLLKKWRDAFMVARLHTLVKSPKKAGEITFRGVHWLSSYCAEGIVQWFISKIPALLASQEYLLQDSTSLARALSKVDTPTTMKMTKLDVISFYFMVTLSNLADTIVGCFSGELAGAVGHAQTSRQTSKQASKQASKNAAALQCFNAMLRGHAAVQCCICR